MMKLEELLSWFDNGGAFGEDPEVVLSIKGAKALRERLAEHFSQ